MSAPICSQCEMDVEETGELRTIDGRLVCWDCDGRLTCAECGATPDDGPPLRNVRGRDVCWDCEPERIVPPDAYSLLSLEDLASLPDPSWLIEDHVPEGFVEIFGADGSFKSFLALDWAMSIAAGVPWLGHDVEPGWVVYIAGEGSRSLQVRSTAWLAAHGLTRDDVPRVRFLPEAVNLLDSQLVQRVARALDGLPEPPRLLVVDTLARSFLGNENATEDMGKFIVAVDGLRGGRSALVVHHEGKDTPRERGSTALPGALDMSARMKRDGESLGVKLSCAKPPKDGAVWRPIDLMMVPTSGSLVVSAAIPAPTDDLVGRVLAYVKAHAPVSKRAVREGVKGRASNIDDALSRLESAGRISSADDGYTPCPEERDTAGHTPPTEAGEGAVSRGGSPGGSPPRDTPPDPTVSVPRAPATVTTPDIVWDFTTNGNGPSATEEEA